MYIYVCKIVAYIVPPKQHICAHTSVHSYKRIRARKHVHTCTHTLSYK